MTNLNDQLRALARRGHYRFNDEGKLVPVDQTESAPDDQPERVTGGSADAGVGNDPSDRPKPEQNLNDLIRRKVLGY